MKRIALIGAALGALAGRALGSIGGSGVRQRTAQAHRSYRRNLLDLINRPSDPRHWHDLEQPGQCDRLQAAKDKRRQKAQKLKAAAQMGVLQNVAHRTEQKWLHDELISIIPNRLNPFYVAK